MKALAITPTLPGLRSVDRPVPAITEPDQVKVRILSVGICGTDREEAAGGRALPPKESTELVIGHEMLGRIVETGSEVTGLHKGDHVVLTVRRPCGHCGPCLSNRPDLCRSGEYRERGIWGIDGFQTEFVVDGARYASPVPAEDASTGVLTEPLSVAEKAIDEAVRIQCSRLPDAGAEADWLRGKRCLVAGLGPIGLLAAMALRLKGAEVTGMDVVDAGSTRPQWLTAIGGRYQDGRNVAPEKLDGLLGSMDVIVEATGVPSLALNLLDVLGQDGICVLTGIPGGDRPLQIAGAEIVRRLVLNNQVLVGSVNASLAHYRLAIEDLRRARVQWGSHVEKLITHRHPSDDFAAAFASHGDDEIKVVIDWAT